MALLLTSVFAPYGIDDDYGRKENKMELFHNQVTREQGIFSYRFHHPSQNLYFLAENIKEPSTILDFPSLRRFKKELKKNYEYVGITFIVPNFKKAQLMAKLVREISPESKIILGGHGTNIKEIEKLIEHDYICKGEGVDFLRKILGEDKDGTSLATTPIKHPLIHSAFNRKVMGVPLPRDSGILITGVGCANRCRFCATAHFFGQYIPYLKTGKEIFDVCCNFQKELGVTDFGVLDENFLKMPNRALELLNEMEKHQRFFTFAVFSSAETLLALPNLDILNRLGITFIWIGVESKKEIYTKNKGVDFKKLISDLKNRGISVLASAILFLEEHDKVTIHDDIDFVIGLRPDYLQFMQLGPMPGTTLYDDYEQKGKLCDNVEYEEKHGQDKIWFTHPNFSREDSKIFLKNAFKLDYETNGASFLRAIETTINGYNYSINHTHPNIKGRALEKKKFLKMIRWFMLSSLIFAENKKTKEQVLELKSKLKEILGPTTIIDYVISFVVLLFGIKEYLKLYIFGDYRRPSSHKYTYKNNLLFLQNNEE
ncbi:MAG: radical SAM protein [Oligoflexia bacterium]|nr:radical SAM protein [Oligoflexia bacterium]